MEKEILEARRKFAKKLRQLRKKKGWVQKELADKAQIHVRHIQRLESNNPSSIELDSIIKISNAFKILPSALLDLS